MPFAPASLAAERTTRSTSASALNLDTTSSAPACRPRRADAGRWCGDRWHGSSRSRGRTRRAMACRRASQPGLSVTTACPARRRAARSSAMRSRAEPRADGRRSMPPILCSTAVLFASFPGNGDKARGGLPQKITTWGKPAQLFALAITFARRRRHDWYEECPGLDGGYGGMCQDRDLLLGKSGPSLLP
jgi:hypothetical protein